MLTFFNSFNFPSSFFSIIISASVSVGLFLFLFWKDKHISSIFCMLPISGSCGWEIERYKLCALQFSDSRIIYWAFEPISFHFCWMPVKRREDKLTSQLGAEMEIWLKRRRRRAWLVETQLGDVRHACGNLVRHHIIHLLAANHPMRTTMITRGIFVNAIILLPLKPPEGPLVAAFIFLVFPKVYQKKWKLRFFHCKTSGCFYLKHWFKA